MRRREVAAFSLSFLDLIACGLGAVILLMVILTSLLEGQRRNTRAFLLTCKYAVEVEADAKGTGMEGVVAVKPSFDLVLWNDLGVEHRPTVHQIGSAAGGDWVHGTFRLQDPTPGRWTLELVPRAAPGGDPSNPFLGLEENGVPGSDLFEFASRLEGKGTNELLRDLAEEVASIRATSGAALRRHLQRALFLTRVCLAGHGDAVALRVLAAFLPGEPTAAIDVETRLAVLVTRIKAFQSGGGEDTIIPTIAILSLIADRLATGLSASGRKPLVTAVCSVLLRLVLPLRSRLREGDNAYELALSSALEQGELRTEPVKRLLGAALGAAPQVTVGGFDHDLDRPGTMESSLPLRVLARSIRPWLPAPNAPTRSSLLASGLLAGTVRTDADHVLRERLPWMIVGQSGQDLQRNRIQAILDESRMRREHERNVVPLLYAVWSAGRAGLTKNLATYLDELRGFSIVELRQGFRLAARTIPDLYLAARRAALEGFDVGVELDRVWLHWGSDVERLAEVRIPRAALHRRVVLLEFDLALDGVVVTHPRRLAAKN
jgi:hypothetical protein